MDVVEQRRELVREQIDAGVTSAYGIRDALAEKGIVNPKTGSPWTEPTIRRDKSLIKETRSEMIGRSENPVSSSALMNNTFIRPTVDWTKVDYRFWDRFRRGKAKGYHIGGLFAQPILDILKSWCLGMLPTFKTGNETADEALNDFLKDNHFLIQDWFEDGLGLGDSYVAVNQNDASLTMVPSNQVDLKTNVLDFRAVEKIIIQSNLDNNDGQKAIVKDEYRVDGRSVTIKFEGKNAPLQKQELTYQNLIGMIPVIHFPFGRKANEVFGHPIYEALLYLFARYDDTFEKSVDGVNLMGNPKPVIEGAENPEQEKANLATDYETWTDSSGTTHENDPVVDFAVLEMIILGKGSKFGYAQPSAFTQDSGRMLEFMFLVMMQHIKIPEWTWGGAVASSMASVEAQKPAFISFIEALQRYFQRYLVDLAYVWYLTRQLVEPMPSVAKDDIDVEWPDLTGEDAELKLKKVDFGTRNGLLTDETSLRLLDLVEDPAAEVEAAAKESEEKAKKFQAQMEARIGFEAERGQDGGNGTMGGNEDDGSGDMKDA